MKLDRLVFRYILDTNSRFQALKAGEGQAMEPQPQLQIAELHEGQQVQGRHARSATRTSTSTSSSARTGHPALKQPYVRQALITGMNRPQVAGSLYGEISKGLPALQSLMYKPFESAYKKNFAVRGGSTRPR